MEKRWGRKFIRKADRTKVTNEEWQSMVRARRERLQSEQAREASMWSNKCWPTYQGHVFFKASADTWFVAPEAVASIALGHRWHVRTSGSGLMVPRTTIRGRKLSFRDLAGVDAHFAGGPGAERFFGVV